MKSFDLNIKKFSTDFFSNHQNLFGKLSGVGGGAILGFMF